MSCWDSSYENVFNLFIPYHLEIKFLLEERRQIPSAALYSYSCLFDIKAETKIVQVQVELTFLLTLAGMGC